MGPKKGYDDRDASEDTDSSRGEVRSAWHNANNDAVGTELEGRPYVKEYVNAPDSFYETTVNTAEEDEEDENKDPVEEEPVEETKPAEGDDDDYYSDNNADD